MTDKELMAHAPLLPILYFDGFGAFRKVNGLLRCVGYTLDLGPQTNLLMSLEGAETGCMEASRILREQTTVVSWRGTALRH